MQPPHLMLLIIITINKWHTYKYISQRKILITHQTCWDRWNKTIQSANENVRALIHGDDLRETMPTHLSHTEVPGSPWAVEDLSIGQQCCDDGGSREQLWNNNNKEFNLLEIYGVYG